MKTFSLEEKKLQQDCQEQAVKSSSFLEKTEKLEVASSKASLPQKKQSKNSLRKAVIWAEILKRSDD